MNSDTRKHKITDRGNLGEHFVCEYLEKHGCSIVAKNYRCRFGEIDIIAENNDFIIFVEVKTRTAHSMTGGFESITQSKIKKFTTTVMDYLSKNDSSKQPRIDCAEVIVNDNNNLVKIDYIENAVIN